MESTLAPEPDTGERAYGIKAVTERLDCSRAHLYNEMRAGRIQARKMGSRTVFLESEIQRYLVELPVAGES